jgi:plasmid replication initiation protein
MEGLRSEHRNVVVEIAPSVKGLATIYDKDILIYCISQVMAKKNAGEPLAQTLHLNAHDLLVWTNRETSGDGYRRLKEALEQLLACDVFVSQSSSSRDQPHMRRHDPIFSQQAPGSG